MNLCYSKIISFLAFITLCFPFFSTGVQADETSERMLKAFTSVNETLYEVEETRNYCNKFFAQFSKRNDEAYDNWELQYSFFLKDYDTNYFKWKNGFRDFQKQQLAVLDNIQRYDVKRRIASQYEEGGQDKCYNLKPALTRPRSNPELKHQEEFNLIREVAMSGFAATREVTGVQAHCSWQQSHAARVKEKQTNGMDEKTQKEELKQYKKSSGGDVDKNTKKLRSKHYGEMIGEIYDYPALNALTYSLYRLSVCELENREIKTESLKKASPALSGCQSTSAEDESLLASCINKALLTK